MFNTELLYVNLTEAQVSILENIRVLWEQGIILERQKTTAAGLSQTQFWNAVFPIWSFICGKSLQ